jgi:bisphosphoglycerate-dependent phosphoglycerate mutase
VFYTQKKISLTEDSPEVYTQKNISFTERVTRSLHTKDLSHAEQHKSATKRQARKKERKKALLQPYTRNKNFDTTGAHKTQPANEGFKVPCNSIQTVVLLWICQQLSRSKNKILDSKRRLRLFTLQTKSSLDHRRLVVFLLLHKNLQASKSHVDELTLSKGVMIICT